MRSQTGRFEAEREALGGGRRVRQEQAQGIWLQSLGCSRGISVMVGRLEAGREPWVRGPQDLLQHDAMTCT